MERNAGGRDAETLRDLCSALESETHFELSRLYDLKAKAFALAMAMIEEWRFDRHVIERRLQKYLAQEENLAQEEA
ncbi:MAG: hypothetical protein HY850_00690 [Betaproteobacteria bacterium]|nr:hypothetical protein [Betaproteobacteria bacterium]